MDQVKVTIEGTCPLLFNKWTEEEKTEARKKTLIEKIKNMAMVVVLLLTFMILGKNADAFMSQDQYYNIMPIGDSITAGRANARDSYRRELYFMLTEAGYNFDFVGRSTTHLNNDFDLDHWGWYGYPAYHFVWSGSATYMEGAMQIYDADVALIHLGTNDLSRWANRSVANILGSYTGIIEALRADNPNIVIIIAQIIPSTHGDLQDIPDLNAAIPGWATQNTTTESPIIVVDMHSDYDTTTMFNGWDGTHPNVEGELFMAERWFEVLTGAPLPEPEVTYCVIVNDTQADVSAIEVQETVNSMITEWFNEDYGLDYFVEIQPGGCN